MGLVSIALGLAKAVPTIARWVGGDNAEKTTQKVVDLAMNVTGASTPNDALSAIKSNPDLAMKLQQAVMDNEEELTRLENEDRSNARQRDVRLREIGGGNWRADVLSIGAFIAFVGVIAALLFVDLGKDNSMREVLLVLVGTLAKIVGDIFQFEFGSSRGSKGKDLKDAIKSN